MRAPNRSSSPTSSTGARGAIARWLGLTPTSPDLVQAILQLSDQVGAQRSVIEGLQTRLASLQEQIERLEKQQARTGKEQFKTNLIGETQQQSVKDMLVQLRESETYREREIVQLRERLSGARGEGRMEVARQIFAVVDGLDEALASGERWLEQHSPHRLPALTLLAKPEAKTTSFWQRLAGTRPTPLPVSPPSEKELPPLAGWLEGLELVRSRLIDVLAAQGIYALDSNGAVFDPTLHVAVEVAAASNGSAPGQIVKTQRRGYRQGDTVLRYAEVVVVR